MTTENEKARVVLLCLVKRVEGARRDVPRCNSHAIVDEHVNLASRESGKFGHALDVFVCVPS